MWGVRRVFRLSLFRRRDAERDVRDEIAFHLAMREARLRAGGLTPQAAAREAHARFGDVAAIQAQCLEEDHVVARRARTMQWLTELLRDAQLAARSLRRAPRFTLAVVLTLALGIGANTVVFSLVDAVVLRPVSGVRDSARLFELSDGVSFPAYRELRERLPNLPLAAVSERRVALGRGEGVEHTLGALVSGNFFSVVGVGTSLGRALTPSDDMAGVPVVGVLSHEYWRRAFGADSSVLGRTILVNGASVAIVGVAAPEFWGLHLGSRPALWMPLHAWPAIAPSSARNRPLETPGWEWLRLTGRLPAGMTLAQAHDAIGAAFSAARPEASREAIRAQSEPRPLQAAALSSGARDATVRFAAILLAVVALVLLTACANITGLLLSRAAYRERELGMRIALGAGRWRLVRQLLTESLVLALAGGVAALGVFAMAAAWLSRATIAGSVAGSALDLGLGVRRVAFTLAVTVATGLLVGLAPALHASRPGALLRLHAGSARRGSASHWFRNLLLTAQVVVGIVLLVGTGLFARALSRAFTVDVGVELDRVGTLSVDPGLAQLNASQSLAYFNAVAERVSALPVVERATWASNLPLSGDADMERAQIDGYVPAPDERVRVEWSLVGPGFHEIMGIRLLAGRGFTDRDAPGAPRVVVINETLARRYFAGRNPVGASITMLGGPAEIIGVARDTKYHRLNEEPIPYAYFPIVQLAASGAVSGTPTLVVRTRGGASRALPEIVQAAVAVHAGVPVFGASTLRARLNDALAPQLAGVWLLGVFSVLSLVVVAVGVWGVIAYAVSQRTRDIGIRMALGATGGSVLRLVAGRTLAFVIAGVPVGLALAVILGRVMAPFLYGVPPADAVTLGGTAGLMLALGAAASLLPARRATRVDPLAALRADA